MASGWPLEGSGHTSVCMSSFLQGFQPGPRISSRGPDWATALWTSPRDHVMDGLMGWIMWPFWELVSSDHVT